MAYIESAFYGDEKSQRNATKVLQDKVLGTTIDVDVNEQLIPAFEVADKVEITSLEEKRIREQASAFCGGVDQACIEKKESELRQQALQAKQSQANSSAGVIKGRRLTVNMIDENGKRRRLIIPDNQKFKLDNVTVNDPKKGPLQVPTMESIQNQFKLLGSLVLSTLVYVFGVAATYVLFMQTRMGVLLAAPATVIAVFIPYSGYVLIFLYFMFFSAVETYVGPKIQ
jgi:hypothetical protein